VSRAEDAPRSLTSTDGAADASAARLLERAEATSARLPAPAYRLSDGERLAVLEEQVRTLTRRADAHGGKLDDHSPRIERLERLAAEFMAAARALEGRLAKVEGRLIVGGGLVYVVVEVVMRLAFGK
jgi:hypothetical protein